MRIEAVDLLDLLLEKHQKDLCIPECKTGASYGPDGFQKIDLWVMKKSWSNPAWYGYEIKVNRQDFLRDEKWQVSLPYCTSFSFVAPPGIIDVSELPPEAGLIVSSKNGTRLYTKKKAPVRQVEIPDDIYRYVLMWRTKVTRGYGPVHDREYWERWLKDRHKGEELGREVAYQLSKEARKQIDEARIAESRMKEENETLKGLKEELLTFGIEPKELNGRGWRAKQTLREMLQEAQSGIPDELQFTIENAIHALNKIDKVIKDQNAT